MKKNKISIFIAVMFLFCSTVAAEQRGAQELVLSGSWIYDSLTKIFLDLGTVDFIDNAPLTIQEITTCLNRIEYNDLSDNAKKEYDKIKAYCKDDRISFDSGLFSVSTEVKTNLEGYYKSNDDIDWIYDRYSRSPLLEVPVVFSGKDYFTMECDMILSENKGTMSHNDNYSNIPLALSDFDVNFPHTAYFSTGYKFNEDCGVSYHLGILDESFGRTQTGSIILSDYFTGATYSQVELYSPRFKYTGTIIEMNVDKYMYSHLFEFNPFKNLSLGIMEAAVIPSSLELRYFNPFTIFHGFSAWRDYNSDEEEENAGAYMCFKMNYIPTKYIRIYGLFAQDQYQTYYERVNWPDDLTPNGMGGQLGIESYLPMDNGYFHIGLEGYYADPYLYIKQSPNWSFVRTYSENIGDEENFYEWLGSPFGPDTIAVQFTFGYESYKKRNIDVTYLFKACGENSGTSVFDGLDWTETDTTSFDLDDWAYPRSTNSYSSDLVTPSGIPEYVHRLTVALSWQPLAYLSFLFQPGYTVIFNNNHTEGNFAQGFELAGAVKLSIDKMFKKI